MGLSWHWFRPYWHGVDPQEWHLLGAATLDGSVRAACGQTWPLHLTHGAWERSVERPRGRLHITCEAIASSSGAPS